jgi:hypothetical protein
MFTHWQMVQVLPTRLEYCSIVDFNAVTEDMSCAQQASCFHLNVLQPPSHSARALLLCLISCSAPYLSSYC